MAEHHELRCLCDYVGGAQAINTWARPTPLAVGGELETDERGEIVYAEIWSPVNAVPAEEELRKVVIVVDGHDTHDYISLNGVRASCMAPPKDRIWAGRLYSFGTPMSNNPLLNTTIKYKQNVTVHCLAGPTIPITVPYRVRLWGYVYKTGELLNVFGTMQFPAQLRDTVRGRVMTLSKAPILVTGDSWLTLPGGKDQSIPKINPFTRYAYNLLATDGMQGDYQFRFTQGGVFESDEDMYWEFDAKDALLIQGLGIKWPETVNPALYRLARTGLRIAGDYHPKGPTTRTSLFPTTGGINELNYGHIVPFAPGTHPYMVAIPRLDRPYLIWNEIGFVVIRDDGAGVVAANTAVATVTGIRIENRS